MQPIELLMAEHRLILKMIGVMRGQAAQMETRQTVDVSFVDAAADFLQNYADHCHHAKEEDILFHDLAKKPLPEAMRQVLEELLAEHVRVREAVAEMLAGRAEHAQGRTGAWRKVSESLRALVTLYPAHVRKEEEQLFLPGMEYLPPRRQQEMIERFHEVDRRLIHEHYARLVYDWIPAGAPAR